VTDRVARRGAAALIAGCLLTACVSTAQPLSRATTMAEAGLIDIRSLVPDIAEDIRYAGERNFVGVPVDGYLAPRCFLLAPAARALQRIELELRQEGLRLKVFDCYRPARAVRHFVRWAADPQDQRTKAEHYPALDKQQLLGDYIALVSGHSRGATVDLTLMDCTGGEDDCELLDMGTPFDFFDPRANTDSPLVTAAQRHNRYRLKLAMERGGFTNYAMEWWHYTLSAASPGAVYDIPIQ
jgi:zinc D-Ala-D-Ala dipeptidase